MLDCTCPDGRARGFLRFYGAARTGRWAGALVQVQNLPQNHLPDLSEARELVRAGDYELFEMCYGSVQQTLSELIRTAFVPSEGHRFIVCDFSAIEARVVAYLAGEKWRLDVFRNGGDIYCASASKMFGVPVVKHGVNGHLRQKGKIAELALGYGGSVGALKSMGALEMGLAEEELQPLVDSWRKSNPNICRFWYDVQNATMKAAEGEPQCVGQFKFFRKSGILFVRLPSGGASHMFSRALMRTASENPLSHTWGSISRRKPGRGLRPSAESLPRTSFRLWRVTALPRA
jgi:DNA polymerase